MFGAIFFRVAVGTARSHCPQIPRRVETTARNFAAHHHRAAKFADFLCARFPHHARPQPRIAESVDQRLDNLLAVFRFAAGKQRVLNRRSERESLNPLRGPIGGNLTAIHPPHLLGVGFEEDAEQALTKLVGDPVFEGLRVARGVEPRTHKRKHAECRLDQTEFRQRLEWFQWIRVKLATVVNARRPGTIEHVLARNLRPKVLDVAGLREEPMPTDIKAEVLIVDGTRDSTDILGVTFEDNNRGMLLRQLVGCGKTRWSGTDYYCFEDRSFHSLLFRGYSDFPTLHALVASRVHSIVALRAERSSFPLSPLPNGCGIPGGAPQDSTSIRTIDISSRHVAGSAGADSETASWIPGSPRNRSARACRIRSILFYMWQAPPYGHFQETRAS